MPSLSKRDQEHVGRRTRILKEQRIKFQKIDGREFKIVFHGPIQRSILHIVMSFGKYDLGSLKNLKKLQRIEKRCHF